MTAKRQILIDMHTNGEMTAAELLICIAEDDAEDEEARWAKEQRARREKLVIQGSFYLILDDGWAHVYRKWDDAYKARVVDFLKALKPHFDGKTLTQLEGTNPGGLCAQPVKLFDGQLFIYLYPPWGGILAVLVVIGEWKDVESMISYLDGILWA